MTVEYYTYVAMEIQFFVKFDELSFFFFSYQPPCLYLRYPRTDLPPFFIAYVAWSASKVEPKDKLAYCKSGYSVNNKSRTSMH